MRSRVWYPFVFFLLLIFYSIITIAQDTGGGKPKDTELDMFPNPAKLKTELRLTLKKKDIVTVEIYDSKGALLDRLYDNEKLEEKIHKKSYPRRNIKEAHTLTVVVKSANNGKSTDYLIFEKLDVTTTSSPESNKGFLVAPNPTNSLIEITSPEIPVTGILIHDMIGNTILNERVDFLESHKVNLAHLHPGIYFLTLRRKEQADVVRIVKTE